MAAYCLLDGYRDMVEFYENRQIKILSSAYKKEIS
jgi:hypothetical protein